MGKPTIAILVFSLLMPNVKIELLILADRSKIGRLKKWQLANRVIRCFPARWILHVFPEWGSLPCIFCECKWEKDSWTAQTESMGRATIRHARAILMIFIAGLGVLLTRVWRMPPTTKIGYNVYSSDEMSMRADIWYHHSRQFRSELRSRALHFILWAARDFGISTSDLRETSSTQSK